MFTVLKEIIVRKPTVQQFWSTSTLSAATVVTQSTTGTTPQKLSVISGIQLPMDKWLVTVVVTSDSSVDLQTQTIDLYRGGATTGYISVRTGKTKGVLTIQAILDLDGTQALDVMFYRSNNGSNGTMTVTTQSMTAVRIH